MTLTQRYALPQWGREEWPTLAVLNQTMERLDHIPKVVVGVYTGNDEVTRFIDLGFRPKAVLVADSRGMMGYGQAAYGGVAVDGFPVALSNTNLLEIVDNGFQVCRGNQNGSSYYIDPNNSNRDYRYLAIQA